MIKFLKLRYRNFLAFGNDTMEIDLSRSPTTLVTGENGVGKSTFLDALTFSLYGKPFRKINKPQLVNSVNQKALLTEVEFKSGSLYYMVRRGIKPNIFEIYQSNTQATLSDKSSFIEQDASAADYQKLLEGQILKMNLDAFTQIVVLGKATYVPFMSLDTPKRRMVIEDLLGLKVFGDMNVILKDRMKTIKRQLGEIVTLTANLEDKIETRTRYVTTMKNDRESRIESTASSITELQGSIEAAETMMDKLEDKRSDLVDEISDKATVTANRRKYEGILSKVEAKMSLVRSDSKFFEDNESCPTCTQEISSEIRSVKLDEFGKKQTELATGLDKVNKSLDELEDRLEEIDEVTINIRKIDSKLTELKTRVREQGRHIKSLTQELAGLRLVSMDEEEEVIEELTEELQTLVDKKAELQESVNYYTAIALMLKDDGIKTLIIDKYLPVFNRLINDYLLKMGFVVKFTLNEKFEEEILSKYRDNFSFNSFSEGQKLRINLAIMLTWREIAKLKNSLNTNLLIMDEVFDSSLDQSGVDAFMDILPSLGDINIFVVSHTPDKLYDRFRSNMHFTMEGNFSTLASE